MIFSPVMIQAMAAAFIAAVCFGAGFTVQGWRMKSAAADAMSTAVANQHALELKVEKQNSGVTLLQYQLGVAKDTQAQAEIKASKLYVQLDRQTKLAKDIQATSCTDMVNQLREVSK